MNRGRSAGAAAILNGLIYVVGGFYETSTTVESYNPKTNEWTLRVQLESYSNHGALTAFNGMLYGFSGTGEVKQYNPKENFWTKVNG